jgi:phage terminase large subunit
MAELIIPYQPRPLQQKLHNDPMRFKVLVWHRRAGKTVWAINEAILKAIAAYSEGKPRPRVAYIAPLLKQARTVAWDYAKEFTSQLPGYKPNEGNLHIDFLDGCRLNLFGSDNPDAARGIYLDHAVLDEYAQMPGNMWTEIIRPALSDRHGSAAFIGTPKGKNSFFRLYERALNDETNTWGAYLYKASETGYVDEGELLAAKNDMSDEEYAQEYECSFEAAIQGAYYSKQMEKITKDGQVCSVPYESAVPVNTCWDLGLDDMTSIWFYQVVGKEIRMMDYYEGSGTGLQHYVQVLRERGYTYGEHHLPHDVQVRELSSGRSRLEILRSLRLDPIYVVPKLGIEDGINAVRTILSRCWFDEKKCARGVEALRQYRTDFDQKTQTFRSRPLHDWTSHAADAFRYLAVSLRDPVDKRSIPTMAQQDYDIFNPMGDDYLASSNDWTPW